MTATKVKNAAAKTTAPKVKAPAPKPPTKSGAKAIALKSDKHVGVVTDALGKLADTEQVGDHRWLWVPTADAQAVVDTLGAWSTEHSKVIYDARLAVATLVGVRRVYPKATDAKTAMTNFVVSRLNECLAASEIASWDYAIKIDGTLLLTVNKGGSDGKEITDGPRGIAKALGFEKPKAERTAGSNGGTEPVNGNGLTNSQQAKADRIAAMKAEGAAVKAWKAAGEVGPKPATPVSDKAEADLKAKEAKAAGKTEATKELAATHVAKQADKRASAKGKPPVDRKTVNPQPKTGTRRNRSTRKAS